jgi:hypothetical protein
MQKDAIIVPHGYRQKEYLLYYLVGEGLQKRNLWVVEHAMIKQVFAYLNCKQPIYVRQLQRSIPPGLKVYCLGPEIRGLFEAEGFRTMKISDGLFQINRNAFKKQAPCN